MGATVTLTLRAGRLEPRQFVFSEPTKVVIGRAKDCSLQIPSGWDHQLISRHHCIVDIDPPMARVHDLGSCNGTYVNGQLIGCRGQPLAGDRVLQDGDELRLGSIVFGISISPRVEADADGPRQPAVGRELACSP
jgi:pSer/pThr/pTyr-binding forkhead associated (FHA) protein